MPFSLVFLRNPLVFHALKNKSKKVLTLSSLHPSLSSQMKFIISHWTGTSFLGRSGWTSKAFARRFETFDEAQQFCSACGLDEQGATIEAV